MNEAERKSLEIRRQALEVFDGKAEQLELHKILHLIERNQPDFLEAVVTQLEEDNGRWSDSSGFPNVQVKRDAQERVQTITFEALGKTQPDGTREVLSIIWRSDRSEIQWVESFTRELLKKDDKND
ncbi:MAG: hypothetical protein IT343_05330 [Candidatus Melainabacteria bacterium]|jgi:hypothetical protein|nr:hypothetical protein [Candidatus Melainabacteria bacterium]